MGIILYTFRSKVPFVQGSPVQADVTYGELPLVFDHVEVRGDSIEIDFDFYYKNHRIDSKLLDFLPYWGAVFVGNSDSVVLYSSTSNFRYQWRRCDPEVVDCPYREVNPLQPEVIDYIKKNKDKLDPWFRQEAIKRGVITE